MKRREFLKNTSSTGAALIAAGLTNCAQAGQPQGAATNNLMIPKDGIIPVAFAISDGATMIDFAGPWEVFQDVMLTAGGRMDHPFRLFTVAEKTEPIRASSGMKIVPEYTFETAPAPKIVVVPAQLGNSALHKYLQRTHEQTDVTMSVCTGAFHLGRAGLLAGKEATTHHDYFDQFEKRFPDVKLRRGLRFVEGPRISTAGGLTSGIDLALRVVERYFGRKIAEQTAAYMEYQSKGWIV
ncbi:MAG TPA: DJ-1/PfpI family protein [Blastocatellia bacterium]|nr:DJ-1/PfpI family protein [Blastocatellia bacterium]